MKQSLTPETTRDTLARLEQANTDFARVYPGETGRRQPVHTVYGGAHLFKSDTPRRLGALALRSLEQFAPDAQIFARAVNPHAADEGDKSAALAHTIYERVREKLTREPIEDFRIDFEDGYGNRPDEEEDGHAEAAAREVVKGLNEGTLSPFIGIRIKPFTEELRARSLRTLDIFISTLAGEAGGQLPPNFVVTLPKITVPEQTAALASLFDLLETQLSLPAGTLRMEMMIETTQSIINRDGQINLPLLLAAARGRCTAAHFGTYDYTASCNITAAHQHMMHPSCDFAKHMMQVSFAGTGLWLSDGATNIMPVAPHRAAGRRDAHPRTGRREPPHRPPRLAHPLRARPTLAHRRLLSGLGPAPRPTPHPLCRRLHLLPPEPRRRLGTPAQLRRKGRQSHPRRRCLRRRRHRAGTAQLLPARPQLRRAHRDGSIRAIRLIARRTALRLIRQNSQRQAELMFGLLRHVRHYEITGDIISRRFAPTCS
jgi:citrate lyase beta subunit